MTKYYKQWKPGMKKGAGGKYYYPKKKNGNKNTKANYAKAKDTKKMPGSRPFVETKFIEVQNKEPQYLSINAESANKGLNTTTIVPECWNTGFAQGVKRNQIQGRAIYPRYLKMKMVLDLSPLPATDAGASRNYNIHVVYGWCTESLATLAPTAVSGATFNAQVDTQLVRSGINGDFLDFNIKRKSIKILGRFKVKGNRNDSVVTSLATDPTAVAIAPPELKNYTFKWKMGTKTWMEPDDTEEIFHPTRSWIPFVSLSSPEFTNLAETQTPAYKMSSKLWFTDM